MGRIILIDGRLCQVVGVLPADFLDLVTSGSNQSRVYLPISKIFEGPLQQSTGYVIGRLKGEIGVAAARAELPALRPNQPIEQRGVNITHLQDEIGFSVRPALPGRAFRLCCWPCLPPGRWTCLGWSNGRDCVPRSWASPAAGFRR